MLHALVRSGDVDTGGIVVGAEVSSPQPAIRRVENPRQEGASAGVDHDLRRLDHCLEKQRTVGEAQLAFELPKGGDGILDLLEDGDLRYGDDPALRQPHPFLDERAKNEIERANASSAQLFVQRLYTHADEW